MPPVADAEVAVSDDFDTLTDRELLLAIARDIRTVRELATQIGEETKPFLTKLQANPMTKLLFGR